MKRYQLRIGNTHGEAASADTEASEKYPKIFNQLIEEKGFMPEQVFNMDEAGLFWKKMPSRTFLMKDEMKAPGFKTQEDRVTLIMCENAAGMLMKPGLIYNPQIPGLSRTKIKTLCLSSGCIVPRLGF